MHAKSLPDEQMSPGPRSSDGQTNNRGVQGLFPEVE